MTAEGTFGGLYGVGLGCVCKRFYRYNLMVTKQGPKGVVTMSWDGDNQLSWTRAQDGLNQLMVHGNHLVRAVGQTTTLTSLARAGLM